MNIKQNINKLLLRLLLILLLYYCYYYYCYYYIARLTESELVPTKERRYSQYYGSSCRPKEADTHHHKTRSRGVLFPPRERVSPPPTTVPRCRYRDRLSRDGVFLLLRCGRLRRRVFTLSSLSPPPPSSDADQT